MTASFVCSSTLPSPDRSAIYDSTIGAVTSLCLEQQLHDGNVEPAAELEADFLQDTDDGKAHGFVQSYAHRIVRGNAAEKRVMTQRASCFNEGQQELLPDPFPPVLLCHV